VYMCEVVHEEEGDVQLHWESDLSIDDTINVPTSTSQRSQRAVLRTCAHDS